MLTSGLVVTLTVTGAESLSTTSGGNVDAPEGRLTRKLSLPDSWFSSAAGSATAEVQGGTIADCYKGVHCDGSGSKATVRTARPRTAETTR